MEQDAIRIRDLSFQYNKTNVLQNVYMTVPKCCIYALLGPSGSGKTTLLRLMLGRVKPKCGTITIFGNDKPGYFNRIIGYMPQSCALSPEMTIGETINYFASIYQLSEKRLLQMKSDLGRIFCLAEDNRVVSSLSGGQQKSLSLALVFLHSPKLVFLDEPTVGTDPLLGDQIWTYLRSNCSSKDLTVIMVTHYIQEASLADQIGMMRNGRMIEEGMPKMLYCKYNETSLETIFIKVCSAQRHSIKEPQHNSNINDINNNNFDNNHQQPQTRTNSVQSYQNKIVAYLQHKANDQDKDLVYHSKNNGGNFFEEINDNNMVHMTIYSLIWLLFILTRRNIKKFLNSKMTSVMLFSPVFCTLLMCVAFKVDKIHLPTAVYNQDQPPYYSGLFQSTVTNFSIHHIKYIQFDELEEAVAAVENGQAIAALWFEKDFSTALVKRALASVNIYGEQKQNQSEHGTKPLSLRQDDQRLNMTAPETMEDPITDSTEHNTITLSPDEPTDGSYMVTDLPAEEIEYFDKLEYDYEENESKSNEEQDYITISNETLKKSTIKVFIDNSNMFYSQPIYDLLTFGSWNLLNQVVQDQGHITTASPVKVQEVIYAEGTEAPDFLLSGYMIGFLYLSQVTLTSQLLILERQDGFFDRAIVAGAKHSLMFFSHFITNLIFSLIQIILMFIIGFVWYSIPNFGSYWLVTILVFFQSTSSIMTGLLISATCDVNFSAFFISLSITLSQLFTSGAIFPIISFDPVIRFFLNITPISMPVESLRNVMLRGWDLSHFHVLHGLITNLATTIVFGSLALYFFKRRS